MKKNVLIIIIIAIIAIVAVIAFKTIKRGDGPGKVAEKFLNHLNKMEFDEAKKYATKESAPTLDLLKNFAGDQKSFGVTPVKVIKVKEEDNKALVICNDGINDHKINLVKEEDIWKVDFKKETPKNSKTIYEPAIDTTTFKNDSTNNN